jgi:hypothetical protein
VPESPSFPYDTRLNIQFGPLELIEVPALVKACTHPWYNQTLCRVNDSVGSREPGGLCPGGHAQTLNAAARGARVARSLSAIR